MDRSWMYDRLNPHRRGLKSRFIIGVDEFVNTAKEQPYFQSEGGIRCPCVKCKCMKLLLPSMVKEHLYKFGFQPNYWVWTEHGEENPHFDLGGQSSGSGCSANQQDHDEFERDADEFERDADGKFIIRPFGKGLSPASVATDALGTAIRQHFQGPYPSWSETPGDVKDYWFKLFAEAVSWDPSHTPQIKKAFQQRGAKRLSDMLQKARMKAQKPSWMGDDAWTGLLTYWDQNPDFKKMSAQNKVNRASNRGGALHTSGRVAHIDVALRKAREIGRNLDPDELFLETHRKKSGEWVDDRSRKTYTEYQSRMQEVQSQVGEVSLSGPEQVDGATKIGVWVEVVGGKSRGRCYGTADMSLHIRRGSTSLTQESLAPTSWEPQYDPEKERLQEETVAAIQRVDSAIQQARVAEQQAQAAEQRAYAAEQRAHAAEQRADVAIVQVEEQKDQIRLLFERMASYERHLGGASTSASHSRHPHPDHDQDLNQQPLDEASPDRRCRRRRRH